jgi:L-asparagine oxygenase
MSATTMSATTLMHPLPLVLDAAGTPIDLGPAPRHWETAISAAGHAARLLPPAIHDALVDFVDSGHVSGALLIRGLPVGALPPTPATPALAAVKTDRTSEMVLLTIARRLGQPVGYEPELGGEVIQNILPVRGTEARQVSTSSKVELMFHTEAAFHPHRPRYLVLSCLRGDPDGVAETTLSSIRVVADLLPHDVVEVLFQPRFRTAVDESYLHGTNNHLGSPIAVLSGDPANPTMIFDADLMVGTDLQAEAALAALGNATARCHTGVVLQAGDVLIVDNNGAVHGRTPFIPHFDGNDRWLQRAFVVADLAPSAAERTGRVITTRFG